jgi:hypothetical protein
VQRWTGTWTFNLLLLTLCITPLRAMTEWHWLLRLRRMLGLFCFFYATLHFLSFIGFDHAFVIDEIARDIIKRPFVTVGFAAFVLLIPLAATSNQWATAQTGRPQVAGTASQHLPDQHSGLRALFLAGQGQRAALAAGLFGRRCPAARLAHSRTETQGHPGAEVPVSQAAQVLQAETGLIQPLRGRSKRMMARPSGVCFGAAFQAWP